MRGLNILFFYCLLASSAAFGQSMKPDLLLDNTVKVEARYRLQIEGESFGFVTGEYNDSLYIATTAHTVELYHELNDSLEITIFYRDSSSSTARVIYFSPYVNSGRLDIVILKAAKPAKIRINDFRKIFAKVEVSDTV
jgi:hypothetical protein